MRFCSSDCVAGYQRRLNEGTVRKIRHLEVRLGASPTVDSGPTRKKSSRLRAVRASIRPDGKVLAELTVQLLAVKPPRTARRTLDFCLMQLLPAD